MSKGPWLPGWYSSSFACDRPDHLRLSISLGSHDGGFSEPTWCWFIYDLGAPTPWPLLAQGTVACGVDEDRTLREAQRLAGDWADRRSGRLCTRCEKTETEIENADDGYCDSPKPHPDGRNHSSQHHFPPWPSA